MEPDERLIVSAGLLMAALWVVWTSIKLSMLSGKVEALEKWAHLNVDLRSQKIDRREREIDDGPPRIRTMWDEE